MDFLGLQQRELGSLAGEKAKSDELEQVRSEIREIKERYKRIQSEIKDKTSMVDEHRDQILNAHYESLHLKQMMNKLQYNTEKKPVNPESPKDNKITKQLGALNRKIKVD